MQVAVERAAAVAAGAIKLATKLLIQAPHNRQSRQIFSNRHFPWRKGSFRSDGVEMTTRTWRSVVTSRFHPRWVRLLHPWGAGLACAVFWALLPTWAGAQDSSSNSSFTQSISNGFSRIGQAVTPAPAPKPVDDETSLQKPGKAGIELYVAVARLYESTGRLAEAEAQYQHAMKELPDAAKDLRILLGYAHLKDQMAEPREAVKLYQKAAQLYPREASVFNNLAVHYARHQMFREAVDAADRAIQLRPKEPKYRNNIAAVLIEMGRPQDAFNQLRAVYDEAVAHYNLGFLLNKKGDRPAAAKQFAIALQINPSFAQARQWMDRLGATAGPQPGSEVSANPQPQVPIVAANPLPRHQPSAPVSPNVGSNDGGVRLLPPPPTQYLPPGDARQGQFQQGPALPPDAANLQRLPPVYDPQAPILR